ncbi:macro domain-containing protein [Thermosphaera chiliense]|nr:macro domain-containing protein [Thermosphaera aggregans]
MKCYRKDRLILCLTIGDITGFTGDAIVNPANTLGLMGGGVALAIKRKGGDEIEKEAVAQAPIGIGEAVVTNAHRLKCRKIIHAPTVIQPGGRSSVEYVLKAVEASLKKAIQLGLRTIAFPLMGAGTGGLSVEESLSAMLGAMKSYSSQDLELTIYFRNPEDFEKGVSIVSRNGFVTVSEE